MNRTNRTNRTGALPQEPVGLRDGPVYLDHNATTPVDPRVTAAALPYLMQDFGNPSSSHALGRRPHEAVEQARADVARLLGAGPGDVVFTGSGSEANLLALRGSVLSPSAPRSHVVTQATEHPAVLATCAALARHHGTQVTVLPVGADGLVEVDLLEDLLARPASAATAGERSVVSMMAANNETGALQPVRELAAVARRHGALVHCDAAQAAGKVELDVEDLGVDLLTVVGHKMYAPKGVAALHVRAGLDLEPVVYGGGQEGGLRAGTENVALVVALAAAARLAAADLAEGVPERLALLRDRLHRGLEQLHPGGVVLNGPVRERLPNTLNVSLAGVVAHDLLAALPGVAASTGSACHSGQHTPSPVLTAMGADRDRALGALRFSVGRWTTPADVDLALEEIARAVR
ncbi:cysteine desulfurase family protein [Nocardioides sp. zg-DK7169]|uniref:cysteine desulfurase family protein n=1 Tax=Nocardioides sp. zg-DK7169 TaxID=2736600 RepID=UPI0015571E12|nr:cysteine desulfurase family protein [Nocardioides sp. zg-DK7169]NPC95884.1 cysteine desulfurase [Nocardioides sp. zg-DK7169]